MAAIVLEDVSRVYQKYSAKHRFQTFKSAIVKGDLFRSLRPDELVTAVDGVSLTIEKGETFGLIGENGSGKSTLLKLVAGIAKPSSGRLAVDGKISALIELGAGFHPEISGRENVFINGIMLGLSKKEIARKFDEIVRFAELEEFIDAPVKTYSSGMYMRLGFSIAINVNPEILLVDEVLAVGDASFVPKCLDRIDDFRRRKKTILFVSHDLTTVGKICDRVAWMKDGKVRMLGEPKRVVDAYLQDVVIKQEEEFTERQEAAAVVAQEAPPEAPPEGIVPSVAADERREQRWGKREIEIRKVTLKNGSGRGEARLPPRREHAHRDGRRRARAEHGLRLRHRRLHVDGGLLLRDEHEPGGLRARLDLGRGDGHLPDRADRPHQRDVLSRCRRPQAGRLPLRLPQEPHHVLRLLDAPRRGDRPPAPRLGVPALGEDAQAGMSFFRRRGRSGLSASTKLAYKSESADQAETPVRKREANA